MKVFITKNALTVGILEVDVKQSEHSPTMVSWGRSCSSIIQYAHGEGKDWHRTHESAVARANKMRLDKIASHKRAIKKLEELSFL